MKNGFTGKNISLTALAIAMLAGCGKMQAPAQAADFDTANGIIHGQGVKKSEALGKSVVALVAVREQNQVLCTGTIIDKDTILTAAHCVDEKPQKITIIFAARLKSAKEKDMRIATGYVQNPFWKGPEQEGQGDLALVHFEGGLPEGFEPVVLASKDLQLKEGLAVTVLGFGVSNASKSKGAGTMRETKTTIIGERTPTEFVTDGRESSVCFGDSGGPAFAEQDGKYVQWGVASSVSNRACNESAVHTSIINYRAWISSTTASLRKHETVALKERKESTERKEMKEPKESRERKEPKESKERSEKERKERSEKENREKSSRSHRGPGRDETKKQELKMN